VRNTLSAIIFSDTEIFSNLELTQAVYDILLGDRDELDFPLSDTEVQQATDEAVNSLLDRLVSRTPVVVRGESLANVLRETIALYRDTESVKAFLQEIEKGYLAASK
jgi:CRISPR-associated protein Csc2